MPDTYWLIDEAPTIPVDYVAGESTWPTPRRGGTVSLTCVFVPNSRTDYTTLGEAAVDSFPERYEALRRYLEFVDAVTTVQAVDGQAYFREQLPTQASVDTQFVSVRPPAAVDVEPFYAVVSGGTVPKSSPSVRRRIELELTYLAPASDYADADAAKTALEA